LRRQLLLILFLFIGGTSLLVSCGGGKSGTAELSESDQAILSSVCWTDLKSIYAQTYHPIMSSKCIDCHSTGHGSKDIDTSLSAFLDKGASTIDFKATHNHGGNSVDVALVSSQISAFKVNWTAGESSFKKCLAEEGISGGEISSNKVTLNEKLITSDLKSALALNIWHVQSWDLDTDVPDSLKNQYHAYFMVEVKYYQLGASTYGVLINNPTIALKTNQSVLRSKDLRIFIGGQEMSNTTYLNMDKTVSSSAPTNLAPGYSAALVVYDDDGDPLSAEPPVISLGFQFSTD
jgi:hypothetical protein